MLQCADGMEPLVAAGGAIPCIIAAMKGHPDNAAIQECAIAALWNMAKDGKFGFACVCVFDLHCVCV